VVSFPDPPERAWLDGFAQGLAEAQAAFSISLAGGDTDKRPGPLSITITALGSVPTGRMVRRATAREGDALFLSGTLGDSALGLLLRRDAARGPAMGLDVAKAASLVARYLRPMPRVALAPHLLSFATAAMDVSDGLVKDCGRLAAASGLAATIDAARLPLSASARAALGGQPDLLKVALTGGDDYEVLAAIAPAQVDAFRAAAAASGVPVTEIGGLSAGRGVTVTGPDGRAMDVGTTGWDHFQS
jgi:thiamine-monophosphate kinase